MNWKNSQKNSRIKILTYENNIGLHHTLKTCCLNVAKGECVARQDDNFSKPERLKNQLKLLNNHQEYAPLAGICVGVFDDEGI